MKITNISIPANCGDPLGLENIQMNKIGDMVVLAGKNGAGKTRILSKIFNLLNQKPQPYQLEESKTEIKNLEKNNSYLDLYISNETLQSAKDKNRAQKKQNNESIEYHKTIINWNYVELDGFEFFNFKTKPWVKFVPTLLTLTDSSDMGLSTLQNNAGFSEEVGMVYAKDATLAKIQLVQNRWFNATHPSSQIPEHNREESIRNYLKLDEYIKIFLGVNLGRNNDGEATLFSYPIGRAYLSDGQKILIQFCVAIYSQEEKLSDLIVILDEPENHLHPSILIETIEKLKKCLTNGQLWISTHSVPLLAHFKTEEIWFVENSKVVHAGKIPEVVLEGLLGSEENILKLKDFLELPSAFASSRYAFECLFEPAVVETDSKDPQVNQIRLHLEELVKSKNIRVLEFGAGKGRLISNINDNEESKKVKLLEKVDYMCYDIDPIHKDVCIKNIEGAYGNANKRYYNDLQKIFEDYSKNSFDVVIMCNVLHEIDPKNWLQIFRKGGELDEVLKDDGYLLLVEDQKIPIGEKAYENGFVVLDTVQIKDLFSIKESHPGFIMDDFRGDGRIKAHLIAKELLLNITPETRTIALESCAKVAKTEILKIRNSKTKTYASGKLHGFWTQQFANATLCLDLQK